VRKEESGDAGVGEEEEEEVDGDDSEGEMQVDGGDGNAPQDLGKIILSFCLMCSHVGMNLLDISIW
jgi:hypothetical protein